ncbi:hypothetical protein CR513_13666, partial [Mucuna pruriens]
MQRKRNGYKDLRDSSLVCEITLKSMKLGMLKVTSDLMEIGKIDRVITHEKRIGVKIRTNKIHVVEVIEPRKLILQRGLGSGAGRMYQNLRELFGWLGLEEEVAILSIPGRKQDSIFINLVLIMHYLEETTKIHGVTHSVVSDRKPKFTLRSLESCLEP